jgi:ATP synthase protein I
MATGGESDLDRRKRDLEAKLATHRSGTTLGGPGPNRSQGLGGMGQALKMSSEFIAAVAVGAAIGWTLDYFAGISPWGLVIFLLLGFVAGILNVMRSAGLVAPSKVAGPGDTVPGPRE